MFPYTAFLFPFLTKQTRSDQKKVERKDKVLSKKRKSAFPQADGGLKAPRTLESKEQCGTERVSVEGGKDIEGMRIGVDKGDGAEGNRDPCSSTRSDAVAVEDDCIRGCDNINFAEEDTVDEEGDIEENDDDNNGDDDEEDNDNFSLSSSRGGSLSSEEHGQTDSSQLREKEQRVTDMLVLSDSVRTYCYSLCFICLIAWSRTTSSAHAFPTFWY